MPNFRDVFNFKGIFHDRLNQVPLALRRYTFLDYSRFFSNAHGKTADDLKYQIEKNLNGEEACMQ